MIRQWLSKAGDRNICSYGEGYDVWWDHLNKSIVKYSDVLVIPKSPIDPIMDPIMDPGMMGGGTIVVKA